MNQKTTSDITILTPSDDYFSRYLKLTYCVLADTLDNRTEGLPVLFGYNPSLTRI
jgi:hypothetical protein